MALLTIAAAAPEEVPRDVLNVHTALARAPSAILRAGCLSASIAMPNASTGFYRGTRFDWAGMITEVRLGRHRFYGPWFDGIAPNIRDFVDDGRSVIAGPQTAATGPAEEFVGPAPDPVPGYFQAAVGGTFLKIGVGRLRKVDDAPYSRFRGYPIVDGGNWQTKHSRHAVTFRQLVVPDTSGFGYAYEKVVRLRYDGVIEIDHRLKNIGTQRIGTQVYNHNFTRFDDRDIVPGVRVDFPYFLPGPSATPQLASVDRATVRYLAALAAGDHVKLAITGFTSNPKSSGFSITNFDGSRVHATSDTPIVRAQLWSIRRVVAVEPFISVDLLPGEEKSWRWQYAFTAPSHEQC